MRKTFLVFIFFSSINSITILNSQNQQKEIPVRIAEINKMVQLNNDQKSALNNLYDKYKHHMDSALYKIEMPMEASALIYKAKQRFNAGFMKLLSQKQKAEYIRNTATPEIAKKTEAKIKTLQKSGDYNESELQVAYNEIFEYFMLEKMVYVNDKYNIERQKENIAQLKKLEPQMLKTANAMQKAKHQGKTYQKGYKW